MDTSKTSREALWAWWRDNLGNRELSHCRERAARLRRADTLTVLAEPALHGCDGLAKILGAGPDQAKALVRVAQALAEVRQSGPALARAFGAGDPRKLSPNRFERLIRSTPEQIGDAVRRALPMVEHTCDPGRLGLDLYWWTEKTRIDWTFQYFNVQAPGQDHSTQEPTKT